MGALPTSVEQPLQLVGYLRTARWCWRPVEGSEGGIGETVTTVGH